MADGSSRRTGTLGSSGRGGPGPSAAASSSLAAAIVPAAGPIASESSAPRRTGTLGPPGRGGPSASTASSLVAALVPAGAAASDSTGTRGLSGRGGAGVSDSSSSLAVRSRAPGGTLGPLSKLDEATDDSFASSGRSSAAGAAAGGAGAGGAAGPLSLMDDRTDRAGAASTAVPRSLALAAGPAGDGIDVDIMILMDTTGSMKWCLQPAKDLALKVLNRASHLRAARSVRCGVVAYRDLPSSDADPSTHVKYLDFTDNADQVQRFISGLEASGGADIAEDVAGGLREVWDSSWRVPVTSNNPITRTGMRTTRGNATKRATAAGSGAQARPPTNCRMILHLWDAPPHGRDHHVLLPGDDYDRYAASGPRWDPSNTFFLQSARDLAAEGIGYVSVRVKHSASTNARYQVGGSEADFTDLAWKKFEDAYIATRPLMDPLDFPLAPGTDPSLIVSTMARAVDKTVNAFSRSIGARMAHDR